MTTVSGEKDRWISFFFKGKKGNEKIDKKKKEDREKGRGLGTLFAVMAAMKAIRGKINTNREVINSQKDKNKKQKKNKN